MSHLRKLCLLTPSEYVALPCPGEHLLQVPCTSPSIEELPSIMEARGLGYEIPCPLPSHFSDWKIVAATSATDSSPPSNRRPTPCEESTRPCPAAGASPRDAREEKGEGRPLLSRGSVRRMTRMVDKGTGGGEGIKLRRSSSGVKGS